MSESHFENTPLDHEEEVYRLNFERGYGDVLEKKFDWIKFELSEHTGDTLQRQGYADGVAAAKQLSIKGKIETLKDWTAQKLSGEASDETIVNEKLRELMKDEIVDPIFKRGFEQGYWLQRGRLASELDEYIKGAKDYPRFRGGLNAGSKEAIREQVRSRFDEADKAASRDKEKGMDIG